MPEFSGPESRIHYDVSGEGEPILLIAPGGMRSSRDKWDSAPWHPGALLEDAFKVIAMDQRNAGASTGSIGPEDGWDTYTADQLGLMDALGCDRFHVLGMCIGGPFTLNLIKRAPERIKSAVVLQTIGRDHNDAAFLAMFDGWAEGLSASQASISETSVSETSVAETSVSNANLAALRRNMFINDLNFLAVSEADIAQMTVPMLVLQGDDLYHPASASKKLAALTGSTCIEGWKAGPKLELARRSVADFLRRHAQSA